VSLIAAKMPASSLKLFQLTEWAFVS